MHHPQGVGVGAGGMAANDNASSSFFAEAPVTKIICLISLVTYALYEMQGNVTALRRGMEMDMDKVVQNGELYRLLTGRLTFGNGGDLVMGTIVLSTLAKRFEREMSSRKFATFVVLIYILSTALEMLLCHSWMMLVGAPSTSRGTPTSYYNVQYAGPYPLVGALFYLFHVYTPRMHPRFFGILGFHFSEKAIQYALCFQVMVIGSVRFQGLVPSVAGIMAGFLCSTPILPLSKIELPSLITKPFELVFGFLVDDPPPILSATANRGGAGGRGGGLARGGGIPPAPRPPPRPVEPPSEAAIEQLTSMGFDRERVERALRSTNNNVERAADQLLTGAG
mmetsp:Transcript_23537/g.33015  ORF Transcript_23537/g.33015 Transcript_23537/m.33015 type:complete len:337 (-) Transcript_23537:171-1181(-)